MDALWRHIGFVFAGLALAYCLVRAFDPPRLNWGDSASDYNVMTTGRNFARYGFVTLRFTPHLLDAGVMTMPRDRAFLYTHYPQLPDVTNGVLRLLGFSTFPQFRLVALLLSFASLFFIYQLTLTYWSRPAAQIALALWVTNPLWIQHADYLHHIPYGAFFGFGTLYALARYLRGGERTAWIALAALMIFFMVFASYDWWLSGPLLVAAMTIRHYRAVLDRRTLRVLGILAAATLAALLLKIASNVWGLGGWDAFVADLRFQFQERATDSVTQTNYQAGAAKTLVGRIVRFFTPLLFVATALWCVVPILRRSRTPWLIDARRMVNPLILLLVILPFLGLFLEMWVAQYYPTVQLLPYYATASALLVVLLIESHKRWVRVVGVLILAGLLGNSIEEDLRFPIAFFDPKAIDTLKSQLDLHGSSGHTVVVNHLFDAQYRYFFDRRIASTLLIPPGQLDQAFASFGDARLQPWIASSLGAVFVQHKHLENQVYDKGYYYVIGRRLQAWDLWAWPRIHRGELDALIRSADSAATAAAARNGHKLYETEFYTMWWIRAPQFRVTPSGLQ